MGRGIKVPEARARTSQCGNSLAPPGGLQYNCALSGVTLYGPIETSHHGVGKQRHTYPMSHIKEMLALGLTKLLDTSPFCSITFYLCSRPKWLTDPVGNVTFIIYE